MAIFADLTPEERIKTYMIKVQPGYWKCAICVDVDFTCSGNVRAHVESHHYSPGYTCPLCKKILKIKNVYTKHIKTCASKAQAVNWTTLQN